MAIPLVHYYTISWTASANVVFFLLFVFFNTIFVSSLYVTQRTPKWTQVIVGMKSNMGLYHSDNWPGIELTICYLQNLLTTPSVGGNARRVLLFGVNLVVCLCVTRGGWGINNRMGSVNNWANEQNLNLQKFLKYDFNRKFNPWKIVDEMDNRFLWYITTDFIYN